MLLISPSRLMASPNPLKPKAHGAEYGTDDGDDDDDNDDDNDDDDDDDDMMVVVVVVMMIMIVYFQCSNQTHMVARCQKQTEQYDQCR